MEGVWEIAVGTVVSRPYVFAFLAAYLLAAIPHIGVRKTILFTICGYLVAFLSEFSSINSGFPYGWYSYIDTTSSRELWIAGVPFFDSLSYVFLCYSSYGVALLILSPLGLEGGFPAILETRAIRRSPAVLLLGSTLQTYLDIIIDPVALRGERWFLGKIYSYREAGSHFGVPLSNYLGWWLTGAAMIYLLQRIDRLVREEPGFPRLYHRFPFAPLLGPLLYLSVIAFNLAIAIYIGERQIAVTGLFITILPLTMVTILARQRLGRCSAEELGAHLADFPPSQTP